MKENSSFKEKITILKYNPVATHRENKKVDSKKKPETFWTANIRIEKYNNDESYRKGIPDDIQYVEGNTATTKGLFTLWHLAMGDDETTSVTFGGTTYTGVYPLKPTDDQSNVYTYIGVGDGTDTASANDTALTGSNTEYMSCEEGFPSISSEQPNVLQVKVEFGPDDANWAWNEWGVFNGNPDSPGSGRDANSVVMFNRRQEEMGTKAQGSTWVIIADLTIAPSAS